MSKRNIPVYQIDSGVPIPQGSFGRIPIADLEIGDSFLFPIEKRRSVQTIASRVKKDTGRDFTIKKMDDNTCRVWRTA